MCQISVTSDRAQKTDKMKLDRLLQNYWTFLHFFLLQFRTLTSFVLSVKVYFLINCLIAWLFFANYIYPESVEKFSFERCKSFLFLFLLCKSQICGFIHGNDREIFRNLFEAFRLDYWFICTFSKTFIDHVNYRYIDIYSNTIIYCKSDENEIPKNSSLHFI